MQFFVFLIGVIMGAGVVYSVMRRKMKKMKKQQP